MKTPFDDDAQIAGGPIDIADSLSPPPPYGVFGIRWPFQALQAKHKLIPIRLLLWTCMDRRIIRPVYEQAQVRGYDPSEILLIAMGGGPVQAGDDRVRPVQTVFNRLSGQLPNLEKVWAVAHTHTCAGIKFMCGARSLADALKPDLKMQALDKGINPELYATQLVLTSSFRLLPEVFQRLSEFGVAEPDEATQSVSLRSAWFTPADAKMLQDIIT